MIVTADPRLLDRCKGYHDTAACWRPDRFAEQRYEGELFAGTNYRMSELTGAVMLAQLRKLDRLLGAMRKNQKRIINQIKDVKGITVRPSYDADGDTQEILVDENGKATIYGLPFGSYWLEESTVPADYYPCAPTKVVIEDTHSTDSPLEVSIPNSKFVNLGLDKDRWHLPVAISLVSLLTFTIILLIIFRKTRGDRNEHE